MVNDLENAIKFYHEVLGFIIKKEIFFGTIKSVKIVSQEEPEGLALDLSLVDQSPAIAIQQAFYNAQFPIMTFKLDNIDFEYEKLIKLGVRFIAPPDSLLGASEAIFDDTCGNYIRLLQTE